MSVKVPEDAIVEMVREEIGKYASGTFTDNDDLVRDVGLIGDDLTAAALNVEKRLGVRVDRSRYKSVHTVNELAHVFNEARSG